MGKIYFGNFPNSSNYDPNLPIGLNKWDEQEFYDGNDIIDNSDWDDDNEPPDEEEKENEPLKEQ